MPEVERKPYYKFKSFLDQNNITQKEVADLIGMNISVFNQKLNARTSDFTNTDVKIICEHYSISSDEYFAV